MATSGKIPGTVVQSANYADQVSQILRRMIFDGQLRIGQRLNEVEISSSLGISRAPLREAIQALANEGLLMTVPNRGSYVRTYTPDELGDLYELRIAIEVHSLGLTAVRANPDELHDLDTMLDDTRERMDSEEQSLHYPEELDFHLRLVGLARSPELLGAARSVHQRITLARSRSGHQPHRAKDAFDEHRELAGRLRAGDAVGAGRLLERHLRESLANALSILRHESHDS